MKSSEPASTLEDGLEIFPDSTARQVAQFKAVPGPRSPKGECLKQKLWGGVYSQGPDEHAWAFGQSIRSDSVMWEQEIQVSIVHARMLGKANIIDKTDSDTLVSGLESVRAKIEKAFLSDGKPLTSAEVFQMLTPDAEDIHAAVESLLREEIGETADRLHAGRSRNDLVATVTKVWLNDASGGLQSAIEKLQSAILKIAEREKNSPMPGFTHTQPAQPITLGFHLMAYFWMLNRDVMRLHLLQEQDSPLGAAAIAGTSLPVDREFTAKELGFIRPMWNALDATSDRDFIGDALHACASIMQHLSRLSHELVFWSNPLIGFVKLDESLTTGSSIMPQKRNPDMAELIRGRAARVIGHWSAFMSMMKGLPLGYNRDQQEDKPALFDSVRLCMDSLHLCTQLLTTAKFDLERMDAVADEGYSPATGVAEALVLEGMAFRQAHEITGSLVRQCEEQGISLEQLEVDDPKLQHILKAATAANSIALRDGLGGPGPTAMRAQLNEAMTYLTADDLEIG